MKQITFKSLLYSLIGLFILASCQNDAIDIQKRVKITITPSQVLESFVPFNNEDLEMYEDSDYGSSKLRITALLYDSKGKLISKNEGLVNDYSSDYTCSFLVDIDENYTLLCFSSAILGTLDVIEYESYEFTGVDNISSLEVTQLFESSFGSNWTVLGCSSDEISISTEQDTLDVTLQPATALVYLRWLDIHANDGGNVITDISGTYSATTTDYWGEEVFTWTIEVEKTGDDVVVKNLSPFFASMGFTAENGYNIFYGYIEDGYIVIPQGQEVGYDYEGMPTKLYGANIENDQITEIQDIYIKIGSGTLTIENAFGTHIEDVGWLDLFEDGVFFSSLNASNSLGVDSYYIIYHSNDIASYDFNKGYYYKTSLDNQHNHGSSLEPALYPNSVNIYENVNLLPGQFKAFARQFIGNDRYDYSEQIIEIEAGLQYMLILDCATMELELVPGEFKSEHFVGSSINRSINKAHSGFTSPIGFEIVRFNGLSF